MKRISKKKVKDKEGHSQTQWYNFTLSPYFVRYETGNSYPLPRCKGYNLLCNKPFHLLEILSIWLHFYLLSFKTTKYVRTKFFFLNLTDGPCLFQTLEYNQTVIFFFSFFFFPPKLFDLPFASSLQNEIRELQSFNPVLSTALDQCKLLHERRADRTKALLAWLLVLLGRLT